MQAEICGVLIGRETGSGTHVFGSVRGDGASQGGAHVTFTQEAWSRIHDGKDKYYPDSDIVGWYHSHPGFGVFLSDQDVFIHENFFSSPGSIAWVYDPHSDEEGCFSWGEGRVTPTRRYEIISDVGNENSKRYEAQIDAKPETWIARWRYASKRKKVKAVVTLVGYLLLALAVAGAIWKRDDIAEYYKMWADGRIERMRERRMSAEQLGHGPIRVIQVTPEQLEQIMRNGGAEVLQPLQKEGASGDE